MIKPTYEELEQQVKHLEEEMFSLRQMKISSLEHEMRYRLALEAVNEGMWDWDLQTHQVYFTPRYYTMLEYSPYEMPPSFETWRNLLHPDDVPGILEKLYAYLDGKTDTYEVEFRLKTKSGNWKWILGRGKVVEWTQEGKPSRLIGTHLDIHWRKQEEARTRKLNNMLRAVRDITQLILREKDLEQIIQGACDIFRYACEYRYVWILLFGEDDRQTIGAESGLGKEFYDLIERARTGNIPPCGKEVRQRSGPVFSKFPLPECESCPLCKTHSDIPCVTLPLRYGKKNYGLLALSLPHGVDSDEGELELLENSATDIAFCIYNLELEDSLRTRTRQLDERVKELNCLYGISVLLEKQDLLLEDFFQGLLRLVCAALQFPNKARGRIRLRGQDVASPDFCETRWYLTTPLFVQGKAQGSLEVFYTDLPAENEQMPFLPEEELLFYSVAERVGRVLERKQSEKELRESRARYRAMFEHMSNGVAVYTPVESGRDFVFVDFNKAGERLNQIDRNSVIGRRILDVWPGVRDIGLFKVFQRVWQSGESETFPTKIFQNGKLSSWRENFVYRLESGEIVLIYCDETQRKLAEIALTDSEQSFRDLVENSPIGISILREGQILYQNPEQKRLGPFNRVMVHAEDVEKVRKAYEAMIYEKQLTVETTYRFHPLSDQNYPMDLIWVNCRMTRITYQGQAAILINMVDITRLKEMERLLKIQDKMSSLGRVAAGIAHEIRNPLSGINIYLDTLEQHLHHTGSDENAYEILSRIQSASTKIESIIKRVMDFAKPGEPRFAWIDILQPVNEAVHLASVTLRKSGINIIKTFEENLPLCHADVQMMEQVIVNLINNAMDAMIDTQKQKVIEVSVCRQSDKINVSVSDSGPGISEEALHTIFDPFFSTKQFGTGIGLTICQRIITDHGGTLDVSFSQWGGAKFSILLPFKGESS
jgi:PAS domain S-box-containing protein